MSKNILKVDVLSKLPNDIVRNIFLDLDYENVSKVCALDKRLTLKVCNETFWRIYGQKNTT